MIKRDLPQTQYNILVPEYVGQTKIRTGSFAKVSHTAWDGSWVSCEWNYCREFFQYISKGIRRVLYKHPKNKVYNMAAFFDKVESELKLEERTEIGPTQHPGICWIKISPWWTGTSMKRSLFTAFLRCSPHYKWTTGDIDTALNEIAYTRQTNYAIKRFLKGHTKYTGKHSGWWTVFADCYRSPKEVKTLLIKPR